MFVCTGGGVESPGDIRFVGSGIQPHLNAREVVEALWKWEGMEDTISLFSDLVKDDSMCLHYIICSYCVLVNQLSLAHSTTRGQAEAVYRASRSSI